MVVEKKTTSQVLCLALSCIWLIFGVSSCGIVCLFVTVFGMATFVQGISVIELVICFGIMMAITLVCMMVNFLIFWLLYRVHKFDLWYLLFKVLNSLVFASIMGLQVLSAVLCCRGV